MHQSLSHHATHDELLLARLYGDDVDQTERAAALDQMASCAECADFFADLSSISTALVALPVPPRRRDFSLTEADAARLRRRGTGWSVPGLIARTRLLGRAMVAVGVAGVLVIGTATAFLPAGAGGGADHYNGRSGELNAAAAPVAGSPAYAAGSAAQGSGKSASQGALDAATSVAAASMAPTVAALQSQAVAAASPAATAGATAAPPAPTGGTTTAVGSAPMSAPQPVASGGTAGLAALPGATPRPADSGAGSTATTLVAAPTDLRALALAGFAGLLLLGVLLLGSNRIASRRATR